MRWRLQAQIGDPHPNQKNISQMKPDSRAELLYEIVWRHSATYEVSPTWLVQEFLKVCDPAIPCKKLSKKQQMRIALHVLKNTRWLGDDEEGRQIEEKATVILENNASYWPESAGELRFHQAIIARDRFDYPAIEKIVEEISGKEPVCKLRKAALLAELGKYNEGETLIAEAYNELSRHHRNDRNSIHVFSRLAWADWLRRGIQMSKPGEPFEEFPSSYKDRKCYPRDHIEDIQQRISEAIKKQQKRQGIEPLFEPGHYRDNSNSVTFSNELHPILLFEGVSGSTGMPLRWEWVSFLVEPASGLVGLDNVVGMYRFSLAIRAANSDTDDVLKRVFSRLQVACIPQNEADLLLNRCIRAIEYWTKQRATGTQAQQRYALDRLRVFIEVLARLMVRATLEQAKSAFRLAMGLGKNQALQHIWLLDSLRHLIQYALKSIPESQQNEVLLDALQFPLQAEIGITDHDRWPNPVIEHPGKRNPNATLDRRIDEIIHLIAPCSPASGPALLRLLPLVEGEFLTADERQKIAEKIWGAPPNYQTIPETGLLKFALLQLPSPDLSVTRVLVRNFLFERKDADSFDLPLMADLVNASEKLKEFPDQDRAIDYFNWLVAWRPKGDGKDPFLAHEERRKETFIGEALAKSIVPSLPAQALTEENFDKLFSFYSEVDLPVAIMALVYFGNTNEVLSTKVEKIIRMGLQDRNQDKIDCSAFALFKWREIADTTATTKLMSRLIYLIESWRAVGLRALLWTARQMYNKEWLSEQDVAVLTDSIPAIFDGVDYRRVEYASRDAVSASLTRAECVKLARDILNRSQDKNSELRRVLEEARNDALPEVRFAEMNSS